jgi:hypothetical protein
MMSSHLLKAECVSQYVKARTLEPQKAYATVNENRDTPGFLTSCWWDVRNASFDLLGAQNIHHLHICRQVIALCVRVVEEVIKDLDVATADRNG